MHYYGYAQEVTSVIYYCTIYNIANIVTVKPMHIQESTPLYYTFHISTI